MDPSPPPVVKRSLISWVFSESRALQLGLVAIIAVTVAARVLPLEMQKRVINEAITLRRLNLLLAYCGVYLLAVVTASGLKFAVNALQTIIAQRALTAMRRALFGHVLTLPISYFRNTPPGMVVNALVTELTQAANFVGMAVAVPVINLLTLGALAVYLYLQNPLLAGATLAIYPLSVVLLPLLQRRVNRANTQRLDATRRLSNHIGDAVTGIHEIHSHAAFGIENTKFGQLAEKLMKVRIRWSLYRDGMKVTNNFFTNLGPFVVFILGGYLAIRGQLELGALVAFLSAQEKLYDPWRELIDYYQVYQDGIVTYQRTMEYFDAPAEHAIAPSDRQPLGLAGRIEVRDLSFVTDNGITLLDGISFELAPGQSMALVGFSGSGKTTLAQCVGQLFRYTGGSILIDGREVDALTKLDIARTVGFVSQTPFIFDGTIEENLLYACRALLPPGSDDPDALPSLDDRIQVLHQTGIFVDTLRFGLTAILESQRHAELAQRLVGVRRRFRRDFGQKLADIVEFFDEQRYLHHSSVADNLVFGTANDPAFQSDRLHRNPVFLAFLEAADLAWPLCELGAHLARETIDILGNLPGDAFFFAQSPLAAEELDGYKLLVERLRHVRLHQLDQEEREALLALVLRFVPGRHKMIALPALLAKRLLEGRAELRRRLLTMGQLDCVTFYNEGQYIWSQPVLNNIFFGTLKGSGVQAEERVNQSIIQLLIEEDFLESILAIGMQFRVGSKGDRLSGGQRQKLAIARAMLKNPAVLILDEATSALDNRSQARIQNLLQSRWHGKSTVIAVVHRLDIVRRYDVIAVMKAGKIVEMGSYDELMARKGVLHELIHGR